MIKSTETQKGAPGTLTCINGIKTALINDHNEAFYWWCESKEAILFHVDGHDDMGEANVYYKISQAHHYRQLNIANFICPAVYHRIVSQIYWLNPHSIERTLINLGKPNTYFSERNIVENNDDKYKLYKYGWGSLDLSKIEEGEGEILPLDKVSILKERPLILDIDLDAFCCHRKETLSFLPAELGEYQSTLGYEERVDKTMDVLAQLPRPNLITIASSQGDGRNRCYVPPFMVNDVGRYLAHELRKLYEK